MDQAERLRIIKANQQIKPMARVITVTSGKGGVGKSNTAINLAIQFRKMGKRVIILDADFGLANIEIMFGAVPKHNLCDLIYQGKNIKEIITWGPMDVGFISGGSGIAGMSIVDTGAGISDAVLEFLVASGEIVLITTPEPTSITDSYSLLKALSRHPRYQAETTAIKMIANRVSKEEEGQILYNKLNAVVSRYLKIPFVYLGSVPQDDKLQQAVMQQTPVSLQNPNAKASIAYENIAGKLMDKEAISIKQKRGMAAFFSHIISGRKSGE